MTQRAHRRGRNTRGTTGRAQDNSKAQRGQHKRARSPYDQDTQGRRGPHKPSVFKRPNSASPVRASRSCGAVAARVTCGGKLEPVKDLWLNSKKFIADSE